MHRKPEVELLPLDTELERTLRNPRKVKGASEVQKQELGLILGKMPFHGNRGYCLGTQNFCRYIRGRPRKGL